MISAIRSMSKKQKEALLYMAVFVAMVFFVVGYASSAFVKYEQAQEESYREKANFCHDRMKSKKVLTWWREHYCKGPVLDAVDPISGKPVMGAIEGE